MSSKRKRPEVESAIAELRGKTHCVRCGRQPIEWHGEHHPATPRLRIANLVDLGYKLDAVMAEVARCEALCRSCHMNEDGRAAALVEAAAAANRGRKRPREPPQPSACAGCPATPTKLVAGLCHKCYMRRWRLDRQ